MKHNTHKLACIIGLKLIFTFIEIETRCYHHLVETPFNIVDFVSIGYLFDDPNASLRRKGSQLSLNFEAYFPGGFFSNPGSRKNSMNESENDQGNSEKGNIIQHYCP